MPAIDIPEARDKLEPDRCTIRNLLIENGQLIETAAEYQRIGKIEEAIKYQKLLHQNLMRAATMADPQYSAQMMQEIGSKPAEEENNQLTSAAVGPSMASPPQPMQINANHQHSPAQQMAVKSISPQQQAHPRANMNLPPTQAAVYPQPTMQQQQIPLHQQQPPPQQMVYPGPGGHYNGFMMQQSSIPPSNSHASQMAAMHHYTQTPYRIDGGAVMYQHHPQMQQQVLQQQQQDRTNQP